MSDLPAIVADKLRIRVGDIKGFEVRRKSVDSRKKPYIQFVYTVDFDTAKKLRIPKKLSQDINIVNIEAERPVPPSPGSLESLPEASALYGVSAMFSSSQYGTISRSSSRKIRL